VTLHPEKRFYPATQAVMTEADIDAGLTRDLYVSLGEAVDGGAWIVRIYVKPFVDWIWGGCLIMALGGLLARERPALPRRATRRRSRERRWWRGMKRFWFLIPLAAFLALAVMLAVGLKLDPREVPSPLIDKPAPKFALQRLDDAGKTIRLDDMRGKVWVLNVWASWCVACREEHPLLVEFAKKKVVPLYGLNYKDQREDANRWLARFGNPYDASLYDVEGRVGIDFGGLRRARDLRHRPERRDPPQAHRADHARRARDQDRAAAEEARCLKRS
jgi:DsbE subfamily thiol:disulfide oxidoreductase